MSIHPYIPSVSKIQVSTHGILAKLASVDKYNAIFAQTLSDISNKFLVGHPTTIPNSAYQGIQFYKPNPIFAKIVSKALTPVSERSLLKSLLVEKQYSADEVRVMTEYLLSRGVLENDRRGRCIISDNVIKMMNFDDFEDSQLKNLSDVIASVYVKGVTRYDGLEDSLDLIEKLPYVQVHQDRKGRVFVVADPLPTGSSFKPLRPGELEMLLSLFPESSLPNEYSSLKTALFEGIMSEPLFPKDYLFEAPDMIPDSILDVAQDLWQQVYSYRLIQKDGRVRVQGERLLSIRLGTPLATWGYIPSYDLLPLQTRLSSPEEVWSRMIPRIRSGIIEEILRSFVSEDTQLKAYNDDWRESFLRFCKTEDYYDMYLVAQQLQLNPDTVESILRRAWKSGLCGISVSSHPRLYAPKQEEEEK
jgi:hypothetical protein